MFQHLVFVTLDSMFRVRFSKVESRVIFLSLTGMHLGPPISMLEIIITKLMGAVTLKSHAEIQDRNTFVCARVVLK